MNTPGTQQRTAPADTRAAIHPAAAFGIDVAAVLLFVAIGRSSHDESGSAVGGIISIAAPLLIGLAVGWLVARARLDPLSLRSATIVWLCTVVIGLALRRTVFDRGIATAFVIVTAVVLCLFLFGWRLAAEWVVRRRSERAPQQTGERKQTGERTRS